MGGSFLPICIVLVSSLVGVVTSHKHPVPTFLWRRYDNGTLRDRNSPDFNEHLNGHPVLRKSPPGITVEPIKLTVWPSKNIRNGDKVTVLWSGITNPQKRDWIGFYCPFYESQKRQLDWLYIADIPGHEHDPDGGHAGYGHIQFTVYNMRKSCQFKFYRQVYTDSSWYYVLGAASPIMEFEGGSEAPLQGHIALTGDPTQMRVMWVSGSTKNPPHVRYDEIICELSVHLQNLDTARLLLVRSIL